VLKNPLTAFGCSIFYFATFDILSISNYLDFSNFILCDFYCHFLSRTCLHLFIDHFRKYEAYFKLLNDDVHVLLTFKCFGNKEKNILTFVFSRLFHFNTCKKE
jgi:hypothetical protein